MHPEAAVRTVHRRGGSEGGAGGGASPRGAGMWGRVGGRPSGAGEGSGYRPSIRGVGGAPWTTRVCPGAHPHAPQGRAPGGTRPRCVRRSAVASRERPGSGQGGQQGRRVGPGGAWALTSDGVNPLRLEGRSVRGRQRMRARVLGLFRRLRAAPILPHLPLWEPLLSGSGARGLRCLPVRVPGAHPRPSAPGYPHSSPAGLSRPPRPPACWAWSPCDRAPRPAPPHPRNSFLSPGARGPVHPVSPRAERCHPE